MLVDAHVHMHGCFSPSGFLNAAALNFRNAALKHGLPVGTPGFLLLTETHHAEAFDLLRQVPSGVVLDGWTIAPTREGESLIAMHPAHAPVMIAAGRQIATSEGLEVLALLTSQRFPARPSFHEALQHCQSAGALAVVPWGFGKWTGRRGRIVAAALRAGQIPMLGDNGGRLKAGRDPELFDAARAAGMLIVPGSDPLPFPREETRVGSYGFIGDFEIDADQPARQLRTWLRARREQLPVYGARQAPLQFAVNQLRMQIRTRLGR